jgi:TRAP-type uncharacterized transport system fused permease subunit
MKIKFKKVMVYVSWCFMLISLMILMYVACFYLKDSVKATKIIQCDLLIFLLGAIINIIFDRKQRLLP